MKALCVAALAALMAWAPTLAGTASAEEIQEYDLNIRIAFVNDAENANSLCIVDVSGAERKRLRCCPILERDIVLRYRVHEVSDDSSVEGDRWYGCFVRDDLPDVADADS